MTYLVLLAEKRENDRKRLRKTHILLSCLSGNVLSFPLTQVNCSYNYTLMQIQKNWSSYHTFWLLKDTVYLSKFVSISQSKKTIKNLKPSLYIEASIKVYLSLQWILCRTYVPAWFSNILHQLIVLLFEDKPYCEGKKRQSVASVTQDPEFSMIPVLQSSYSL